MQQREGENREGEAIAWSSERREFSVGTREEAVDAREAEVDRRERAVDQTLAALGQLDDDADDRAQSRAEREQQRQQRARNRLQRDEHVHDHLTAGEYPLAARFAQLATKLFAASSPGSVLDELVHVSAEVVGNLDAVSVTVYAETGPHTPAASNEFALELDQLQYRSEQGPSLDAVATTGLAFATSADLTEPTPWPQFAQAAAEVGCSSVLALGMFPDTTESLPRLGSLNIYSTVRDGFSEQDRQVAMLLAAHGAVALATATGLDEAHLRAEQLNQAMLSRDVIGQAKGILMERQKCTPEQAFDMLRDASNRLNTKLFDLAERLAATGEPPSPRAQR